MPRQHLSLKRLARERLSDSPADNVDIERPRTRADCADGPRPCPYVGCRHHLLLETKAGALRLAVDTDDIGAAAETCSLDVADRGPHSLPEVANLLGVSRQRVSQVEIAALRKLRAELVRSAGTAIAEMLPSLLGDPEDEF